MSAKLKAATALAGGALTALAIPAASAQAATPPRTAGSLATRLEQGEGI